ncbi:MAG: ATP synthase F1 subunit delta [Armatimonadetes bacterium]|nr:ATP synthase F1 subunit delta [Armatimonadota bacterium]
MIETRAAGRYARALFNAALRQNTLDAVRDDLIGVAGAIENDARFRTFVVSKDVNRQDKLAMLDRVFSDRITALTLSAIRLMVEKGRDELIPTVRDMYLELQREHENVQKVVIWSAAPLEDKYLNAIVRKIEIATSKKVVAETKIDPALMGGVKVDLGTYVMDGSVTGSLNKLREKLVYDLLKQS